MAKAKRNDGNSTGNSGKGSSKLIDADKQREHRLEARNRKRRERGGGKKNGGTVSGVTAPGSYNGPGLKQLTRVRQERAKRAQEAAAEQQRLAAIAEERRREAEANTLLRLRTQQLTNCVKGFEYAGSTKGLSTEEIKAGSVYLTYALFGLAETAEEKEVARQAENQLSLRALEIVRWGFALACADKRYWQITDLPGMKLGWFGQKLEQAQAYRSHQAA